MKKITQHDIFYCDRRMLNIYFSTFLKEMRLFPIEEKYFKKYYADLPEIKKRQGLNRIRKMVNKKLGVKK